MNYIRKLTVSQKLVEAISLVIVLMGIITSIKMNFVGRSLWFDEAALAYSFCKRGFFDLTADSLDLVQSAPVGWLYIEKLFVTIFGVSDFNMRILSIVFYVLLLAAIYYIMRVILKTYYKLPAVAFAATLPLILQYSNVFKPYIADTFFCLLAIIIYDLYVRDKINIYILSVIWVVLIWCSSPVCFVIGGLLLTEFIFGVFNKDKTKIIRSVIGGVIVLVGFALCYFYWLRKVDNGMFGWWGNKNFPLIPTSLDDLRLLKQLTEEMFSQFFRWEWLILVLLIIAAVYAIYKKNRIVIGIYLSGFVGLFASFIGMYPINKRIWLFIYPLIIIAVFYLIDGIVGLSDKRIYKLLCGAFVIAMSILNSGIYYYWNDDNVYWREYEVKAELEYLDEVIDEGDKVYVLASAKPMFLFYNDYEEDTLLGKGNEVMIGDYSYLIDIALDTGQYIDHSAEYDFIMSSDKCYIVASNSWNEEGQYTRLYDTLRTAGTVEVVYDEYDTPLLLFERYR